MADTLTIDPGFTDAERGGVGALYWEAFGRKLLPAFGDPGIGRACVTAALRPDRMLTARLGGALVGVCGFTSGGIGAVDLSWSGIRARLGAIRTLRALALLAPLARRATPGVLVLDGICVSTRHRGHGIGTRLLDAAAELARSRGEIAVQLSVIDANPRAEVLYRRLGFAETETADLGPFATVYGFRSYRTLQRQVGS